MSLGFGLDGMLYSVHICCQKDFEVNRKNQLTKKNWHPPQTSWINLGSSLVLSKDYRLLDPHPIGCGANLQALVTPDNVTSNSQGWERGSKLCFEKRTKSN